ncbi:MAG: hypothetical protein IJL81_03450 [Clostridia bacterium]|nr:hypothetical protein [Clostridia bacterium]MBQ7202777.1 hypothetical protein [Eubacterium sp.]
MPRSYIHISQYEKEILDLKQKGYVRRAIAEELGLDEIQIKNFLFRYSQKQKRIEAGKTIHKKGRPCKTDGELPPSIQRLDKLAQMRYTLASKERYIKRLEMENELMRDFLSLTERK